MSFSVEDVHAVIASYKGDDQSGFLRLSLLNHEALKFGDLGYAFLVQEQEDWSEQDEGELYFVFRIESEYGSRWFKIPGWRSSYEGANYYLRELVEVKSTPQVRYTWERVK